MSPAAPAWAARTAFDWNVQCPRVISAKEPASEPRGSGFVPAFGFRPIPQSWVGTGWPFVPVIAVTSTSERSDWPHSEGAPSASGLNGMRRTDAGAVGTLTASAGANTCVLEVAATPIASGAVDGEPVEPKPKSSRSLPADATTTTPARVTFAIVSIIASVRGSMAGEPPE